MTPVLALTDVSRRYRRRGDVVTALDNVTLTVAAGETVGLVGPSGSGKSTLARLAMALERPDTGLVRLEGVDLAACRPAALRRLRRRWSMVFQDSAAAFNPRVRVFDAIADPLRVHRLGTRHERMTRVARLLVEVDLDPALASRPVHAISGGQRQRVAIARALATNPALIVLDEAVSSLDTVRQDRILRLLVDLQRRANVAFLFISHDLAAVHAIAHRTAVLDRGRIVDSGPTRDLVRAPESPVTQALVAAVPALTSRAPPGVMSGEG